MLGLPQEATLIAFGAMSGTKDPRKGIDLLKAAFAHVDRSLEIRLLIFGESKPIPPIDLGFPVHYVGQLREEGELKAMYSAADAVVIPSRQDNLPNVGLEAMCCAVPVVAFDVGGLSDIIIHQKTGWLANPYDPKDLAEGISWTVRDKQRLEELRARARADAVSRYSYATVGAMYKTLYESLVDRPSQYLT
jgi:glycosyltransferase involved in cell wall biosynthesis